VLSGWDRVPFGFCEQDEPVLACQDILKSIVAPARRTSSSTFRAKLASLIQRAVTL
jgi:hypothetical protein